MSDIPARLRRLCEVVGVNPADCERIHEGDDGSLTVIRKNGVTVFYKGSAAMMLAAANENLLNLLRDEGALPTMKRDGG